MLFDNKLSKRTIGWSIGCCVLSLCVLSVSYASGIPAPAKRWMKRADQLSKGYSHKAKRKAAKAWLKAHELAPDRFETMVAAARACNMLANTSKRKADIKRWGKRGWALAKKIKKRWPKRAEGYFWAAVNAGQYARGGGVWVAISKGLAAEVEKMCRASLKRNKHLYKGAAQKVLGRYYFRLPWPMRKLQRSLKYLNQARKLAPNDPSVLRFLADVYKYQGKKAKATTFYKRCARMFKKGMPHTSHPARCQKMLEKM